MGLLKWWMKSCDFALARLEHYEGQFGSVDGAAEFRRCCDEAKQILEHWVPPTLSKATGLHASEFSEDQAKQLSQVLESGAARLRGRPRSIQ